MNRRIDSHKLMLHPEVVCKWKAGEQIYPIYVEMSPTSVCNYKCSFCALDFIKRGASLGTVETKDVIYQMAGLGVKSIMFAGEGEPLAHKDFVFIAQYAKQMKFDIALTTNGSMLSQDIAYDLLPVMSWIKVSLSSSVFSTFCKMSGLDRKRGVAMIGQTLLNIYEAVEIKKAFKHKCDIGVQMLVTEENVNDISHTIITARELGVDYIVLKQYSHHPSSINQHKTPVIDSLYENMGTEDFKVIIRRPVFGHAYDMCHALPFWSYIASNGDVSACSSHIPDPRFILGNIYRDRMIDIWAKMNYRQVRAAIDVTKCRTNCRMNACNEYLHEVLNPGPHVNFI